ncbi:hypothetical protein D9M71_514610 [compost metagenome]
MSITPRNSMLTSKPSSFCSGCSAPSGVSNNWLNQVTNVRASAAPREKPYTYNLTASTLGWTLSLRACNGASSSCMIRRRLPSPSALIIGAFQVLMAWTALLRRSKGKRAFSNAICKASANETSAQLIRSSPPVAYLSPSSV